MTRSISITLFLLLLTAVTVALAVTAARHGAPVGMHYHGGPAGGVLAGTGMHFHG